jgi:hypothetical protein
MVIAVFVWFESTFDFMTDGFVPKEMRLFAMILTPSAGIHLALLLKQGRPVRYTKIFSGIHLWNGPSSRRFEQYHFLWTGGPMD